MSNINFKHLIGLLVICALLSACGKDNKKTTAATTSAPVQCNPYYSTYNPSGVPCPTVNGTTAYNPVAAGSFADFESFRTAVRNSQFRPVFGYNEVYPYYSCSTSTDKWLIFSFNSTSCSKSFEVNYLNGTVSGSSLGSTEAAIKAKLIEIVNAASGNAGSFRIDNQRVKFISGDYIYEYHMGIPAVANPVSRASLISSARYDLYILGIMSYSL
ncbi:MAG: hypothetical protein HYV97_03045 [Bdellovibrio sp.]|nr:hypothetical protein [Bdellovibrio sp.]